MQMNIINPGGQPVLAAARETVAGFQDARQLAPASVRFDGSTQPATASVGRGRFPGWQAQTLRRASSYVGVDGEQAAPPFQPLTLRFLHSLLDTEKMSAVLADDGADTDASGQGARRPPQAAPRHALRVVVSSAVELDARQKALIARKMQRLTGFVSLALEYVVDASLIAGIVICYGQDESQVIDLSVRGQLAALKNRADSFEQRAYHA